MVSPRERPLRDPEWTDQALCAGRWEMFFSNELADKDAARRLCRRCPVIAPCLEDALTHESWNVREHAGIRAGLSPQQLLTVRRRRNRRSA